ncbi:SAM-dependent methyltransferase [Virgisporangium ochraceum]|uniref:S-adenosyl-L-methionine-dependent methyltransferase n=1 Tax=Virgisporangium ochraceum TaxID=65505 RepID=A0A8J3ZV39_9ACTN|nr:SAM-dependent methyltransferase [Virgisporangium ochraceum]GIJ70742.1 S-adenosyl-L-methionine-dependent methyltransferase [Virgisporangium ochraceum]
MNVHGFDPVARTSLLTTALRIRESARPDRLYDDPYAAALAGEVGVALFDEVARLTADSRAPGLPDTADYNAVRTRFIDDRLAEALASGAVDQVVIAAAGMDTRAYRLDWPHPVDVYELDRAAVLDAKEAALHGHRPAGNVRRHPVPTDLVTDDWRAGLTAAGFEPARRAVWVLEGVLYYLTAAEVHTLLADLGRFAAGGSPLICDLLGEEALDAPPIRGLLDLFASWGSPWVSGSDEPETLLAGYGFTVTATQPGEPGADYGRWTDTVPDRSVPGVARVFLVHGTRD